MSSYVKKVYIHLRENNTELKIIQILNVYAGVRKRMEKYIKL